MSLDGGTAYICMYVRTHAYIHIHALLLYFAIHTSHNDPTWQQAGAVAVATLNKQLHYNEKRERGEEGEGERGGRAKGEMYKKCCCATFL